MKKTIRKHCEDVSDAKRVITGERLPRPRARDPAKAESRKITGLRREERAFHLDDDKLEGKYKRSCQKVFENGSAIFEAKTAAVASAKLLHAPLIIKSMGNAVDYSFKGAKQAVKSEIWRRELVDRGYVPALGLLGLHGVG